MRLFEASSAVTVKLTAVPTVAEAGAVTEKCVAVRGGGGTSRDVVELGEPQALRKYALQTKSKKNKDFFMTPPKGRTSCFTWTVFAILGTADFFRYLLRREIVEKTGKRLIASG